MGLTPLHVACRYGYLDLVRTFLDKGADVDYASDSTPTPLCVASCSGSLVVVKFLLDCGAKVDAVNAT